MRNELKADLIRNYPFESAGAIICQMNCPNCGSNLTSDQKFCRACGAELKLAVQALNQIVGGDETATLEPTAQARVLPSRGAIFRTGFVVLFLGLGLSLVSGMEFHLPWLSMVGVLTMIAGMFLVAYASVAWPRSSRKAKGLPTHSEQMPKSEPTNKLPAMNDADFTPSVIEGTTELLKEPASKRRIVP